MKSPVAAGPALLSLIPALLAPASAGAPSAEDAAYAAAAEYSAAHAGLSVLVMKDGKVVYEDYRDGFTATRSHQLASGTKSFWGIAAAAAVQDGFLNLDEKAADTISEWKADPLKSRITVRNLLSFTSGLRPVERLFSKPQIRDRYAFSVASPAVHEPGSRFEYDDVHLYCFGELLRRKLAARAAKAGAPAGDPLAYLKRRVLDPLGLRYDRWARDGAGNPALPYGAVLTAREWAKFGEFMRQGGRVNGRPIVSAEVLKECVTGSKANAAYGLTWWLNQPATPGAAGSGAADAGGPRSRRSLGDVAAVSDRGIYPAAGRDLCMAAGAGQQRLYVWPSRGLVVVRQANKNLAGAMLGVGRMDRSFSDAAFLALISGAKPPEAPAR